MYFSLHVHFYSLLCLWIHLHAKFLQLKSSLQFSNLKWVWMLQYFLFLRVRVFIIKCHPVFSYPHNMVYPLVIKRDPGVHTIFPLFCTFFPPAYDACEEPCIMNAVCVRASTVALTGIFGLIIVSCTKHDRGDPLAAALRALCAICEGNLDFLQRLGRGSKEACSAPAADCSWGWILH